jgi:hypothetical protein
MRLLEMLHYPATIFLFIYFLDNFLATIDCLKARMFFFNKKKKKKKNFYEPILAFGQKLL